MSLPPGWQQHIDPTSGNPYYHCPATGQTTWDRPAGTDGAGNNAGQEAAQPQPAVGTNSTSPGGIASNGVMPSGDSASPGMTQMGSEGGATSNSAGDAVSNSSQQAGFMQPGSMPDSSASNGGASSGDNSSIVPVANNQQFNMGQMAPQGAAPFSNFGQPASDSSQQPAFAQGGFAPSGMGNSGDNASAATMTNTPQVNMSQMAPQQMAQQQMAQQQMAPQQMAPQQMAPQGGATSNGFGDAFSNAGSFALAGMPQSMMQQAMPQQGFPNGAAMNAMNMAFLMQQQAALLQQQQQAAAAASAGAGVGAGAGMPGAVVPDSVKTGTVKTWNEEKGFGFVDPADGNDNIFVHRTQLLDGDILAPGDKVQFELEFNAQKGKMQAKNVRGAQAKGSGKGETAGSTSPSGSVSGQQSGTVKTWFEDRGFGFVTLNTGEDCYVHRTNLKDGQTLLTGSSITLNVEWDSQRNKYKALSVMGAAPPEAKGAGKGDDVGATAGIPGMPSLAGMMGMAGLAGLPGMAGMAGIAGMAGAAGLPAVSDGAASENRYNPY